MATDQSEPKTKLIAGGAVFTVVALVLIRTGLVSYFHMMNDQEQYSKNLGRATGQISRLRSEAEERLARGAMPIEQAMAAVAQGQRPAAIAPQPSTVMDPLVGWMQNQQALPMLAPPPPPPPPVTVPTTGPEGAAVPGATGAPGALNAVEQPATGPASNAVTTVTTTTVTPSTTTTTTTTVTPPHTAEHAEH